MSFLDLSPVVANASVRVIARRQTAVLCVRGFTLIETMMVVVIVAILAAVAGPSMVEMYRSTRLSAALSALQVSLNIARSEAIKRGSDARVTVAANGTAGAWENGWSVFVDTTTDGNGGVAPVAGSANLLEVVAAPTGPLTYSQNPAPTTETKYFRYNGQGRLVDASGAAAGKRQSWFSDTGSERYCLIVTITGRARAVRSPIATPCPEDD